MSLKEKINEGKDSISTGALLLSPDRVKILVSLLLLVNALFGCAAASLHSKGIQALKSGDQANAVHFLRDAVQKAPRKNNYFHDYAHAAIEYAETFIVKAEEASPNTISELKQVVASLKPFVALVRELHGITINERKILGEKARSEIKSVNAEIKQLCKRRLYLIKKKFPAQLSAIRTSANKHYKEAIVAMNRLQPVKAERELNETLRLVPSHKYALKAKPFVSVLQQGIKAEKKLHLYDAMKAYYKMLHDFKNMKDLRKRYSSLCKLAKKLKAWNQHASRLYAKAEFKEAADIYKKIIETGR